MAVLIKKTCIVEGNIWKISGNGNSDISKPYAFYTTNESASYEVCMLSWGGNLIVYYTYYLKKYFVFSNNVHRLERGDQQLSKALDTSFRIIIYNIIREINKW